VLWLNTSGAGARTAGLFGTIIEAEGRYKFVSHANDL
jgi:hypothetical protein